jgi:hypothetical protein
MLKNQHMTFIQCGRTTPGTVFVIVTPNLWDRPNTTHTSDSRTGAPGKRKAEHDADEHGEHATTEDLWGSFAKDCGCF